MIAVLSFENMLACHISLKNIHPEKLETKIFINLDIGHFRRPRKNIRYFKRKQFVFFKFSFVRVNVHIYILTINGLT